ncbi:S8 family serine peptidase [Microbacterium hominis]|uniref:S8 family serine peptidase n=2 Tax=Microbacterium hominis TaxID=162426 RepID=A0A7D4UKR7_9MICO|nr:S8 family serine peptidase [Microbacterium hominis]
MGGAAWALDAPDPVPIPDGAIDPSIEAPVPLGVSAGLDGVTGTVEVTVRLAEPAIAESVVDGALAAGTVPTKAEQKSKRTKVDAQQKSFAKSAKALGATELGSIQLAGNVVAVSIDAADLDALAALDNVISVTPLGRYETHSTNADEVESGSLAQAIDYVEAGALHDAGYDGSGVKVAVLDSGIDYTHFNLGGPGDVAFHTACFAVANAPVAGDCADYFGPSAPKVKGGYDFVGDDWPTYGAVKPDANPLDAPSAPRFSGDKAWDGGHGTHVADIIGGRSADESHQGIAPGADLYAVKVCSSVSTSCNGVAILQGMDWSLDPNGDGDISDAVDIVNMSLGSAYGQDQDDSSFAAANLVHAGVTVVVSAGNSADRPFIVGSPSSAPGVISVAQTALPDDLQWVITTDRGITINRSVHQSWSPLPTGVISADLARPTDAGGIGCSQGAFPATMAGKIALIARGICNVSDKALFAQRAGAIAAIIYNNVAGDAPSFSFGSAEAISIPTLTITQAAGTQLVNALATGAVVATIDPASAISLANTMVGTSSRGVTVSENRAKPDIGAPGAWLSAETATGTEETNFGGTSGAAPVVSGAAALLLDKFEKAPPAEIKARLLNGADNANTTPTATGFVTTPISRIGAGEVRVAPAAAAVSWLAGPEGAGNVGFGIPSVTGLYETTLEATLTNTTGKNQKYSFATTFRDAADQASGAVSVTVTPKSATVPKGKTQKVTVHLKIDGAKLADWPFNSVGSNGDGTTLNAPEFDGWITATGAGDSVKLGWTVLPRKAAELSAPASATAVDGVATVEIANASPIAAGPLSIFGLTGTSPELPATGAGAPGSNAAVIDLAATGVRSAGANLQFAMATYERRTVLTYPAEFDVYIDTNNDGQDDFVLYNAENGGFGATGQSIVNVFDLNTGVQSAFFFNIGGFDSSTQVFTVPAAALGLTAGQTFGFSVYAFDNYFTGNLTDAIEGQSYTLGSPKYTPTGVATIAAGDALTLPVSVSNVAGTSESGLLLLYGSAAEKDWGTVAID